DRYLIVRPTVWHLRDLKAVPCPWGVCRGPPSLWETPLLPSRCGGGAALSFSIYALEVQVLCQARRRHPAHVQAPEAALRAPSEGQGGPVSMTHMNTLCRGRRKWEPLPSACSQAPYGTERLL